MSVFAKGHVPWIFSTVDNASCNQQLGSYTTNPVTTFFTSDGISTHVGRSIIPQTMSYSNQTSGLLFNTFFSSFPACNKGRENMGVAVVDTNGDVYLQAPKFYNWLNVYDNKPYSTIFNPFSSWPEFAGKKWSKVLLGPGVLVGLTTTGELWTIANDVFSSYSGNRYSPYNGSTLSGSGSSQRGTKKALFDNLDGTLASISYLSFDRLTIRQTYFNSVDFYRPQKIDIFNNVQDDGEITLGSRLEGPAYLASILNNRAGIASCDTSNAAGSWLYNDKLTYAKIAQMYGYRYVCAHDNRDPSNNTNYISPDNNFHRFWNGSTYQCMPATGKQWLTSITLKGKITNNWKDIYITSGTSLTENVTIFAINQFDEVYAWGYNNNFLISTQQVNGQKFDTPIKVHPQPPNGLRDIDGFNAGGSFATYGIDRNNRLQFLGTRGSAAPIDLGIPGGIKKIVSLSKPFPYVSIYGIVLGQDNKLYKLNTSTRFTTNPADIINSTLISNDTWLDISIGDTLFPGTYANNYDKPNVVDAIRSDGVLYNISIDRDYGISITIGGDQFSLKDSRGNNTKFLKVATDCSFGNDTSINSTYTASYGFKTIPSIVLASSRTIPPTPTPTNTTTPSNTPSQTRTPTSSQTSTPSQTRTPSQTSTPSRTPTSSQTPTNSATVTTTQTPSNSPTSTPPVTPTRTPSQTPTSSETPTVTPTNSKTPSQTPTESPTETPTQTPTNTETPTQTPTISNSATPTRTPTSTITPSPTVSESQTATPSSTETSTPTPSISESQTPTPTVSNSETPTPTVSNSQTPTPTVSESQTQTPTLTPTLTPFLSATPTPTQTATQTSTSTQTPTETPTQTGSATPTTTPTNTITNTVTRTGTVTPTQTRTQTPTNTVTSSVTPTQTITKTPTGTIPTGENLYFWGKNINTDKTGNTYKLIPDNRSLVQYAQQPKIESLLENLSFSKVLALSIGENLSLSFGISSEGYLYGWGGSDDPDTDIYTENMYPKLIRALVGQPILDINYGQIGSSNNYVLYLLIRTASGRNTIYELRIGNNSASLGKEATIDAMALSPMAAIPDSRYTYVNVLVDRRYLDNKLYCLINKNNKYLREIITDPPVFIGTRPNTTSPLSIISLGFGQNHTMAIREDGTLWARGLNEGRFGDNNSITSSVDFVRVGVDDNWSKLVVGHNHTLAIKKDGSLWAWGFNNQGQLGCNDYISRYIPTNIPGDWKEVYIFDGNIGQNISYGIQGDGSVWYWGAGIGTSPRLLDNSYNYESFSFSARSFDPTPTPTNSVTPSNSPTNTQSVTPTSTSTPTQTPSNTVTNSQTPTITPTNTPTNSETPTNTPTNSVTPSNTPTISNSPTETPTNTPTPSQTPTNTVTPGLTATATETPTPTPSQTPTNSETPTNTATPSNTPTNSETPTNTPTNTATPSETPTNTPTNTKTPTYTPTQTITPSNTRTPTPSPRVIEKLILSQITRSAVLGVSNLQSFAQSFVAPQSGRLSKIEVEFVGSYTGQGILEVYEGSIDSILTKDPLYSATVSVNANNNFNLTAWVIPSGTDIFLSQGIIYTFKFIPVSNMPEIYGLVISTKDKYTGGLFCSFDETNTIDISKLDSGTNVSVDIDPTTDFAYITNLVFNSVSSSSYSIIKSISSENMIQYIGLETNGLEEKRAINSYDIYTTDNIIKTPIAVTISINELITEEDFNKLRIGYVNNFGLLYDITSSRNYAGKTIVGHMPETGKIAILPISDGITPTPTVSSSSTPTGTPTQTPSATPTHTPTNTVTPGLTATATETPTVTPSEQRPTPTPTPT